MRTRTVEWDENDVPIPKVGQILQDVGLDRWRVVSRKVKRVYIIELVREIEPKKKGERQ